jgi:hypothetical protein
VLGQIATNLSQIDRKQTLQTPVEERQVDVKRVVARGQGILLTDIGASKGANVALFCWDTLRVSGRAGKSAL